MLHINQKFKPVMTKPVIQPDYTTPSIQGKGLHELISKIKDLKIKENHRKRNLDKISFS